MTGSESERPPMIALSGRLVLDKTVLLLDSDGLSDLTDFTTSGLTGEGERDVELVLLDLVLGTNSGFITVSFGRVSFCFMGDLFFAFSSFLVSFPASDFEGDFHGFFTKPRIVPETDFCILGWSFSFTSDFLLGMSTTGGCRGTLAVGPAGASDCKSDTVGFTFFDFCEARRRMSLCDVYVESVTLLVDSDGNVRTFSEKVRLILPSPVDSISVGKSV